MTVKLAEGMEERKIPSHGDFLSCKFPEIRAAVVATSITFHKKLTHKGTPKSGFYSLKSQHELYCLGGAMWVDFCDTRTLNFEPQGQENKQKRKTKTKNKKIPKKKAKKMSLGKENTSECIF